MQVPIKNPINICNLVVKTINFKQNVSSLTHKYQLINIFTINSLILESLIWDAPLFNRLDHSINLL